MSDRINGMEPANVDIGAVIDALPAQICILDRRGSIVSTNRAWREFADEGGVPPAARSFEGENYLDICAGASGEDADYALRAAAGIRAVLDGAEDNFRIEYPCDTAQGRERWFRMVAAPLPDGAGAVAMHTDVTAEYKKARELKRDEQFFRLLFDASPLPKWVFEEKTQAFLAVNNAAVEHYGYSREEFLAMTILEICPDDERARLEAYLKQGSADEDVHRAGQWRHRLKNGREIDVEIVARSIEFQDRDARLVVARDVTESLHQQRVREIETQVLSQISTRQDLKAILRTVAAGIEKAAPGTVASVLLLDADRKHIRHGAAPSLPASFTRAVDGIEIGPRVGSCGTAMYRGETVIVEDIRGDPLWQGLADLTDELGLRACWSKPVFDTRDNVVGSLALYYGEPREPEAWEAEMVEMFGYLVGVAIERQRQDEALRISEQRLRKLFREAATGIAVVTADGGFLQANEVLARMLEFDERELMQQNFLERVHADDRAAVRSAMRSLLAGASAAETLEYRFQGKAGRIIWVRARLSAQTGRDGRPTHVIAVIEDITEKRETEQKLERARSLQRVAGRIGRVGGWAADPDRDEVFWSPEIFNIVEWEGEDAPPLSETLARYPPEHRRRIEDALQSCAADGVPFDLELEMTTYGGRRLQVRAAGEAERDASGQTRRVIGAFQDISEQKRLEARRQQLSDRLESTLANMSDAFLLVDREWRVVYLNRSAEQLVEQSREHLLGRVLWDEFPDLDDTIAGERYRHAMETGESVHFELYYDPLENWFEVNAYPTEEGVAVYFSRTTERRKLEAQLQQSQRLESVGQLTGGIAHDFNNLLTVILGNAELLTESLADSEETKELAPLAGHIEAAAMRGAELTRRLLAFARRQPLEPEPVDVNTAIRGLEPLLRRALGEHVEIEVTRGAGIWPAMIDAGQFESALMNLAINARDAMPDGGRLTIETANVRIDDEYQGMHPDAKTGQYVLVAVSDTGTGIAEADLGKVFEPFFTTKEKGRGTGLGLSMVYGFIKQSEGHVGIYSELGEGTTVKLYLPRAHADASTQKMPESLSDRSRGEAVLVVEDDPAVRAFAVAALEQLGYRVQTASSGDEALAVLEDGAEFDLLFTDVVMPGGMSGRELAGAATELRPGLRVLYTSGYTENSVVHHGRLDPDVQLLSKPYRRDELARRVRRVLDEPARGKDL